MNPVSITPSDPIDMMIRERIVNINIPAHEKELLVRQLRSQVDGFIAEGRSISDLQLGYVGKTCRVELAAGARPMRLPVPQAGSDMALIHFLQGASEGVLRGQLADAQAIGDKPTIDACVAEIRRRASGVSPSIANAAKMPAHMQPQQSPQPLQEPPVEEAESAPKRKSRYKPTGRKPGRPKRSAVEVAAAENQSASETGNHNPTESPSPVAVAVQEDDLPFPDA